MKHVALTANCIQELVFRKRVTLAKIPGEDNPADILTEAVTISVLRKLMCSNTEAVTISVLRKLMCSNTEAVTISVLRKLMCSKLVGLGVSDSTFMSARDHVERVFIPFFDVDFHHVLASYVI